MSGNRVLASEILLLCESLMAPRDLVMPASRECVTQMARLTVPSRSRGWRRHLRRLKASGAEPAESPRRYALPRAERRRLRICL